MRKLLVVLAAVSLLVAMVAVPSAGASHDVNGTVCLVADQGGFDDGGFNAGALVGLERADRKLHVATEAVAAEAEAELPGIIESFVGSGECDLIIGVGFIVGAAMEPFVVANPVQRFAVVDFAYESSYGNVAELLFQVDQAAFLAGYVAAGISDTGKVGVYGGANITPVTIFMDGYALGVEYFNEQHGAAVEVLGWDPDTRSGVLLDFEFQNPELGREVTLDLFDQGADTVFAVAGPTGLGSLDAAAERKAAGDTVRVIEPDFDWYELYGDPARVLLTSVLKNTDVAVFNTIRDLVKDAWQPGPVWEDLASGGVGIAPFHKTNKHVPGFLKNDLKSIQMGIIDGTIPTLPVIRIGLNADLSGPFAPMVTQIVDGQEAFWQIVNDNGGIAGRQVELVIRDSGYDPATHLANYEEMSSDGPSGVLMFSHSTGAPQTAATAPLLVDDDLIAIPLSWYSAWAEPGFGANVMELQANYCIEAMNGVSYLADANSASTVAILSYPDAGYGRDGATGAKIAAEALGLTVVYDGEGAVIPGTDQSAVINELVDANPDIVWATIGSATLPELLGGAYTQGLRAQWSGNSPTWDFELLATDLGPIADEVYTHSSYTQLWDTDDSQGMNEMMTGMRTQRPDAPLSNAYIISWTQGYATQQLLEEAAAGGEMTRAGVVAALQDVNVEFKGLAPDQTWRGDPNDHIVRATYMYDVDISNFTAGATVSGAGAGTGFTLLEGPFVSDTAAAYTYEGACVESG